MLFNAGDNRFLSTHTSTHTLQIMAGTRYYNYAMLTFRWIFTCVKLFGFYKFRKLLVVCMFENLLKPLSSPVLHYPIFHKLPETVRNCSKGFNENSVVVLLSKQ